MFFTIHHSGKAIDFLEMVNQLHQGNKIFFSKQSHHFQAARFYPLFTLHNESKDEFFQSSFFRGPTVLKSICLNPSLKAGDSGLSLKSNLAASANIGSA
jgi:hypothetical protein